MLPMSSEPAQQLVNQELERALLGGLLRNPANIEHLGDFSPESYAVEWHATIHRCLAENPGGGAIALMKTIALNDPELRNYMGGLFGAVILLRSTDLREYAHQITDLHRRRGLVQVANQLRQDALSPDAEATTALALARGLDGLDAASVVGPRTSSSHSFDDALQSAMQAADDAAHGRGISGVATGFPSVDRATGGPEAGTLTVLAGRPGMDKTALGWQMAVSAARSGVGTLPVSLEMSSKELGHRALAFTAGVPATQSH